MHWNREKRYVLLLKIIEQNPQVLSLANIDVGKLRSTWPDDEVPTSHMIPKQLTEIRREIQDGCISSLNGSIGIRTTPVTPSRSKVTPTKASATTNRVSSSANTPSKRTSTGGSATPNSSAKKRKLSFTPSFKRNTKTKAARYGSDDDLPEQIDLTSSSDEECEANNDATDSDDPLAAIPLTGERRVLPARSKSRSKSYVADVDSAGEDAGAKATDSEADGEFKLEGEGSDGRDTRGDIMGAELGNGEESSEEAPRAGVVNGNSGNDYSREDDETEDVKVASDAESLSTKRNSFQSALEVQDEDDG